MSQLSSIAVLIVLLSAGLPGAQESQLQLKTPIQRTIAPGDVHEYVVNMQANHFFHVLVMQQGIDVVLSVTGPDGSQLVEMDSPTGATGSESVELRAIAAGTYRVRVVPFKTAGATAERYTITLQVLRPLSTVEIEAVQAEADVAAIERRWEAALATGDLTTLAAIMSDDGVALEQSVRSVRGKAKHLPGFEQGPRWRQVDGKRGATISERVVKVFGDTAYSTGRAIVTSSGRGEPSNQASWQFIHVFQKSADGWKLVVDNSYPYGRLPHVTPGPVTVDRKVLAVYEGAYRLDTGATFTMRVAPDGKLFGEFRGFLSQGRLDVIPVSDTTFLALGGAWEITFVRSAHGDVPEFIIVSDGPAIRARRVN